MNCIIPSAIKPVADKYGVSMKTITTATYNYQKKYGLDEYNENDPKYNDFINEYLQRNKTLDTKDALQFKKLQSYWDLTKDGELNLENVENKNDVISTLRDEFGSENVTVFADSNNKLKVRIAQPTLNGYTKEMLDIKEQAIADGTFMKAPNGKPTNLNEKQWLQVRTKAFKEWFGDWINDPTNASKVVDENGEPLVVYHGSPNVFTQFDKNLLGSNTGANSAKLGFFFSKTYEASRSYVGDALIAKDLDYNYYVINPEVEAYETNEYYPELDALQNEYQYNMITKAEYEELYKKLQEHRLKVIKEIYDKERKNNSKVKSFFLNIRNIQTYSGESIDYITDNTITKTIEDGISKNADGVLIKNIKDPTTTDDYIVFNSTQIKSATDNVGSFSREDDNTEHSKLDFVPEISSEDLIGLDAENYNDDENLKLRFLAQEGNSETLHNATDPKTKSKFGDSTIITVGELLNNLLSNNSKFSKLIENILPKLGELKKLRVYLVEQSDLPEGDAALYYGDSNTIEISNKLTGNFMDATILHEVLHAIVYNTRKDPKAKEEFSKLFKDIKNAIFKKYGIKSLDEIKDPILKRNLYGLTNEDEFISEFFTNNKLKTEIENTDRNFIQKLINWVKKHVFKRDLNKEVSDAIKNLLFNFNGEILDDRGSIRGNNTSSSKMPSITLTEEQQKVVDNVVNFVLDKLNGKSDPNVPFITIKGMAGTGKTTVVRNIIQQLRKNGVWDEIAVSALSRKAVGVLHSKTSDLGVHKETLYTLAGANPNQSEDQFAIDSKKSKLPQYGVVFVDEASMVGQHMYDTFLEYVKNQNVAIVFLGDYGQLRPIAKDFEKSDKSPIFREKTTRIETLTQRIRQGEDSPILPYADNFYDISTRKSSKSVSDFRKGKTVITDKGAMIFANNDRNSLSKIIDAFRVSLATGNPNHIEIVTATNERVSSLNNAIHNALFPEHRNEMCDGDLITFNNSYVTESSEEIENAEQFIIKKVYDTVRKGPNGIGYTEFLIESADGRSYIVKKMINNAENMRLFKEEEARLLAIAKTTKKPIDWRQYYGFKKYFADFSLGYAITTHKAQGSTYDMVVVDMDNIASVAAWDNENLAENIYTALTRARNVAIVLSEEDKTTTVDSYEGINDRIEGTTTSTKKTPVVQTKDLSSEKNSLTKSESQINENEQTVTVAPYFRQKLNTTNKEELLKNTEKVKERAAKLAKVMGLEVKEVKIAGGTYQGSSEITYQYIIDSTDQEKIDLFASLMGDLSFEYQDAVIAANYVKGGQGNAIEITLNKNNATVESIEADLNNLGIEGSTYHFDNGNLTFFVSLFDWDNNPRSEEDIENEINNIKKLISNGYEYKERNNQNSRYLDNEARRNAYKRWLSRNSDKQSENGQLYNACKKALAICEAAAPFYTKEKGVDSDQEVKAEENSRISAAKEAATKWDKDFKFSKVESKLNTVVDFCNSHFVFDENNHEYHVIQNGKIVATAKKTASGFKYYSRSGELRYEPIKEEDLGQYFIPSTKLGTTVDTITRDFFRGELKEEYPNFTDEQLSNLISDLQNLKDWADKNGIRLMSADFPMIGSINGELVGGAMDLLGYDMNGNIYIFDMKNKRSENDSTKLKNGYTGQQNVYTGLFNAMCQEAGVEGLNIKSLKILQFTSANRVPEYRDIWYEAGEDNQIYVKGTNEKIQDMSDYNAPRLIFKNANIPGEFAIDLVEAIHKQIEKIPSEMLEEITDAKTVDEAMVDIENELAENGQVIPETTVVNQESNVLHDGTIKDTDLLEIANGVITNASILYNKIAKGDENAMDLYQEIMGITIPNKASEEYRDFERIVKSGRENIPNAIPIYKVLNYIKESMWREDYEFVKNGGLDEVDESGNPVYTEREKYIANTIAKCYENFDALIENGYAKFTQLEQKGLNKGVEKEDLHFDGEQDESINVDTETVSGKDTEHWMVEQMSVKNSLSATWRRIISMIYETNDKGEVKYSDFGLPKTLTSDTVINNLLYWFKGCTNVNEMISVLEKRLKYYPEYQPILDIINSDEQLKSQFFQNFRKDFQTYSITIANKNPKTGKVEYITKVINNSSAADFLMNNLGYKFATGFKLLNDIFSTDRNGVKNPKIEEISKLRSQIEYVKSLFKDTSDFSENEEKRNEFSKLLESFGLKFSRQTIGMFFDDLAENFTFGKRQIENVCGCLTSILSKCERVKNLKHSLFKENAHQDEVTVRNEYKNIFEIFNDYLEEVIESSCYENEKMHYSFNPPSYTGKLFINLTSSIENPDKFNDFIKSQYGKYKWFNVNSDNLKDKKPQWLAPWLDILHEENEGNLTQLALKARTIIGHKTQLAFNKTPYVELSPLGYLTSIFTEFYVDKTKDKYKKANYRIPIMSNKPSSEFVTFIRFDGANYKTEMIRHFQNVAIQELMRMRTVLERAANPKASEYANYDIKKPSEELIKKINSNRLTWEDINSLSGTGAEFKFLSFLNNLDGTIEGAKELKEYFLNYLNHKDVDESLLTNNFGKVFVVKMNEIFERQISYFESIGLFDTNEEFVRDEFGKIVYGKDKNPIKKQVFSNLGFLNLKSKTLEEQRAEARKELENFFWNDMLASINIIELTATDLAYYKNVEDFQKRFAQIHAPGLRLNVYTQHIIDGKLQRVSDGKSRTAYIKDKEYNTGIENDVSLAFNTLIEKETDKDRISALRSMKAVIARALQKVNVADAQAFTSPTGMMKKLVMAGKWTSDMDEAYNRICSGDFNFTDLEVLMQPLKPFVYSQIEKNSYAQTMSTIKMGLQNKNSEYLILLSDAIMRGAGKNSNKLVALFDFMEASAYDGRVVVRNRKVYKDNVYIRDAKENEKDGQILERGIYNAHGIDTIQFESAVKVGKGGVVNVNEIEYDDIIRNLKDFTTSKIEGNLYDDRYVHEFDYEDYAVQQEVPPHLVDHKQLMGSQMRVLVMSDILPNTPFEFATRSGKKLEKAKDVINYYQELIAKNVEDSFKLLEEELKFDRNTTRLERNKVMSELLLSEIKKDVRYGADLRRACELVNGEFVIPPSDPIQSVRIQQLIHSIIKSRINKQKVPGGPVVQATSWGIDKKYKIKWKDSKHSQLAYFECAAPVPTKELERDLIELARTIDGANYNGRLATPQEAIDNGLMTKEQLKGIGYRIPTEDKYSIYPMRIVEWVPKAAGEVIILPEEITKLTGSDFDIDKTYVYLKSFTRSVDYKGLQDLLKRKTNLSDEEIKKAIKNWNNGEPGIVEGLIQNSGKKFVYYNENVKDNKDGRNNEIFDIQWAMLTHENTIDKMFNPGSFDPQKETAARIQILKATSKYKWEDLEQMSLDELEDVLKTLKSKIDKNICYIETQIQFHQQNMTAGKLIGIFANNNVSHAFVQMQNVSINFDQNQPITFSGIEFNSSMKIDSMYAMDNKTYISKNIAGYLGASVDAVKDPVLNYMNLNTFTSGVAMLLTRLGFDIDSVGLFLSQPSIIKATQLYVNLNNDGYISANDAIAKVLDELDPNWRNSLGQQSSKLTKEELAENINKEGTPFQVEVLKAFYKLSTPAQNLNSLTFITKFNSISNAAGPNISDTILLKRRVDKFLENLKSKNPAFSTNAEDVLFKSPILKAFYKYTISDEGAAKRIFENWFPHYTVKFGEVIDRYEGANKSPLNDKIIDKLLNEFLLYKLTYKDSPFAKYFTEERRNYFINKFPQDFVKFKENHPELANNALLSAINIKTGNKKCNLFTLQSQVSGYSSEMQELAKTNWSDMFLSEDKEVRDMAEKMFVYCLYRNGFGFSPKTFIHLASVKTKLSLGYTKLINNIEFFNDLVDVDRFLEQFKRNHITESKIVPDIKIETKPNAGTVVRQGNTLIFQCNGKKEFINDLLSYDKTQAVSMIKYKNEYFKLSNSDKIGNDDAFAIYDKVEPLGNTNNFLEYDMNKADIQTVIDGKNVDDPNADNDPESSDYESTATGNSSQINMQQDSDYAIKVGNQQLDKIQQNLKDLGMDIGDSTTDTSDLLGLDDETKDQIKKQKDDNNICD